MTFPDRNLALVSPGEPLEAFAIGWRALRQAGGVPVVVKPESNVPAWRSWQTKRFSTTSLEEIAAKNPTANLGVNCGKSQITVVDLDNAEPSLLGRALSELGRTPLIVRSPRGYHLYYRSAGEGCGSLKAHPDVAWQMPGDIKGRGGFVVTPPSVRPTGSYSFLEGTSWVRFGALPQLPADHPALAPFRKRHDRVVDLELPSRNSPPPAGVGHRNNALFNYVLRQLAPYNGARLEQVQARAFEFAEEALRCGLIDVSEGHPFTTADVVKAIAGPIQYTAEGRNFHAFRQGSYGRLEEEFAALAGDGDAYMLLCYLRAVHGNAARFALAAKSMAETDVLPGWSKRRYVCARDRLLEAGFLYLVYRGGTRRGDAHQYELVARPITSPKGAVNRTQ